MGLYHYTECGLNNVYLENGYTLSKDGTLFIEDIHGLHTEIARRVILQGRRLKGKEIRFVRHFMDLSQKALGEMLGVDYQTVHRWESGKNVIPKTADRFLKVVFHEYLDPDSSARMVIDMISDRDNNRGDEKISLLHKKNAWRGAA